MGRAEAGVLHDPCLERRRVCPLWRDASEHLFGLAPAVGPLLPGPGSGAADVCRTDHRETIIEVKNLTHVYTDSENKEIKALDGINLEIRQVNLLLLLVPMAVVKVL